MSKRPTQTCDRCLKTNIRNMVRHLSYCVPIQNVGVAKKRKNSVINNESCLEPMRENNDEEHLADVGERCREETLMSDSDTDNVSVDGEALLELGEVEGEEEEELNIRSIDIESCVFERRNSHIKDKQHDFEMDIFNFCHKIDAPLYAYDELMKILEKHDILGAITPGGVNNRFSLQNNIKNKYPFLKNTEPIIKMATMDDGSEIEVVTFDFLSMLTSLLNDDSCMNDDSLTFPNDNPYSHPIETGNRNEFHTGSWYRDCWKNRWKGTGDFVLGIIFFIDKTFTDVYGRLNLLPVQFTLTIFNHETRTRFHSWRPLGYVNDMRWVEERDDNHPTSLRTERNLRNIHNTLKVILDSLEEVQRMERINYDLVYRGNEYGLNLIPIVGPIIGDSEEHDVLVGRYGSYNRVQRICRYCDCSFFDSDNPYYAFTYTKQEDIKGMVENHSEHEGRIRLNEISYHHIKNAFHTLDFGGDERGLHGLCPAEILHCVRLGLFKMAVTCFYNNLQPRHRGDLDKVVNIIKMQFKHQSDRCVPRTSFKFVISDLTKITASEWIGIVLLLTNALLTKAGLKVWRASQNHDSVKNDFIKLFERLLILDEWLRKKDGFDVEELDSVRNKLLTFLVHYKRICKRREGNEMKILKYHLMVHVIDDIKRLGAPQNVNGGPCESNFIPQKREAKRTQKRSDTFTKQMAMRMHENLIFSHALNKKHNEDALNMKDGIDNNPVGGSKFEILRDDDTELPKVIWSKQRDLEKTFKKEIIAFVFRELAKNEQDTVQCFTEHKVNKRIFRSDCSYRGNEEWFDWVSVIWKTEEERMIEVFAKIHMFVDCRHKTYDPPLEINGIEIRGKQLYAVISSLKEENPVPKGVSKLFLQGNMYKEDNEIVYYVVPVETMNETALVIQDVEDGLGLSTDTVLIMKPCDLWKHGIALIDQF